MPLVGVRKLYHILYGELRSLPVKVGRDRLFDILREEGLLACKKKKYRVCTTNSAHPYKKYDNLLEGKEMTGINEVYVSDITYLKVGNGEAYLSLISDKFSRRILGYSLKKTLSAAGAIEALRAALRGVKDPTGIIHHSDRGTQYCSHDYTSILHSSGMKISMSRKGNPYDNAVAERIFGILKGEFGLNKTFKSYEVCKSVVEDAIKIYNEVRPHLSLGYRTPAEVHAA
jgi:transposase InsO family protein